MAKDVSGKTVGAWAFLVGVILVLVLSVFTNLGESLKGLAVAIVLLVGVIVGFMNISRGETTKFIIAALSLVIVSSMGNTVINSSLGELNFLNLGAILSNILTYLMILVIPALIIVALKSVFEISRN